MNYYNEWDSGAAAWLRELINKKLIPNGYVDERSITEVTPSDLEGFTQCHFFAGIGGWPLALQLAGVPESTQLWTGSPPCQPFSVAGKSLGFDDERHLAPAFLRLIRECKPELLFGEQVAAAIGKHWLDFVFLNLEEKGYTCGAAVLPACSVGAPHKRDRLFFGAINLAESLCTKRYGERLHGLAKSDSSQGGRETAKLAGRSGTGSMADTNNTRPQGRQGVSERTDKQPIGSGSVESGLAYTEYNGHRRPTATETEQGSDKSRVWIPDGGCVAFEEPYTINPHHSFWSDADWLGCRDGKFRSVEPGTFPLANGIPARVGRLRGYGNAIVPQVAAEFVKAFFYSIEG